MRRLLAALVLVLIICIPLGASAQRKLPRCAGLEIMLLGKQRAVVPTTCLY